jgi:multidrug resistance efflux pump
VTTQDTSRQSGQSESAADETAVPFRERALGGAPNPLERIDHVFHHTSRRTWLGVLGIALLLAAGVSWAAVAKQTITVDAPTVIAPASGVFTAGALEAGTVTSVVVHQGEAVRRGQVLAKFQPAGVATLQSVRSPVAGSVVAIEIRPGDQSTSGAPMFVIAPPVAPMAIALVPSAQVSQLAVGQTAAVNVNGVEATGRVAEIGALPVTDQRLQQLTGDSSLVDLVRTIGPAHEVQIALPVARAPSGLSSTGGQGSTSGLPVGERAVSSITVRRQTLIGKVFG